MRVSKGVVLLLEEGLIDFFAIQFNESTSFAYYKELIDFQEYKK